MAGFLKLAVQVVLSLIGLTFCLAALLTNFWAYFDDSISGFGVSAGNIGYFSPFRTCKVDYNYFQGEKCDINPKVRLSSAVFFSGISASMSAFFLAISSGLTIVQLINVGNRKPAVVKNSAIVLVTLLSALSSVAGFALFLIQGDDLQRGFQITWGPSFYAFVFSAVLSIVLFIITICDYMNIRKRDNSFGLTVRNTTNL